MNDSCIAQNRTTDVLALDTQRSIVMYGEDGTMQVVDTSYAYKRMGVMMMLYCGT